VLKAIITAIVLWLPSWTDETLRHAAYDAKLAEGQAERWAGAYRTSRGEHKTKNCRLISVKHCDKFFDVQVTVHREKFLK